MGKLLKFIENREPLKLVIMGYEDKEIDIITFSNKYYVKHWEVFKRLKDKKRISEREFNERLNSFIWIEKVSELLIILYLEDLKGNTPTIWRLNKLLKRTSNQHSATLKEIQKLKALSIVFTKPVPNSPRNEINVYINKEITTIYGDDEFRQMMLDEWGTDAKAYTKLKLEGLLKEKGEFEKRIEMIKKGKRVKKKNG